MKKAILPLFFAITLGACSGGSSNEGSEEVSAQQESEIVDSINSELESAQKELESETEETLNEIDSLLQTAE